MKQVTYQRRTDGATRPGVRIEGKEYRRDTPVVVSENVADQLSKLDSYEFEITDAPEGHVPEEEAAPVGESAGGFGGSQGSVEVEPDNQE